MRFVDRILQRWRERKAESWIPADSRVLDIGCHQGEFLQRLGPRIRESVGLDPLAIPFSGANYRTLAEPFQDSLPFEDGQFDAIVLLATLEHIRYKAVLPRECWRLLRSAGRVIITVPSPRVDAIVHVLVRLGLADGMSLDEHHGFDPRQTESIFQTAGFDLEYHRSFQLGLNHLYVFAKQRSPLLQPAP